MRPVCRGFRQNTFTLYIYKLLLATYFCHNVEHILSLYETYTEVIMTHANEFNMLHTLLCGIDVALCIYKGCSDEFEI